MDTRVVCVKVKDLRSGVSGGKRYQNLKEWMADERNVYIGRGGGLILDGERYPKVG